MEKTSVDERGWRIANAVLWYVVLVTGCFSRETYEGVRHFARVNRFDAWVNNPWFLPIALSYVVAQFVRNKGISNGLNAVNALYEGIGFGLISLVAFSALPMGLLMIPLPSGTRLLYLGYVLKIASWLYLATCLTRYLIFGNDKAFFRARACRRPMPDSARDES
jgi:uncharacterized membrane protein YsdA (DUF1294 family)